MYDADLTADQKVASFILREFRADRRERDHHLNSCIEAEVVEAEGSDGEYGCDTGCEFLRLTATIRCSHGHETEYEYGTFGQLADLIEDLDQ